MRGMESTRRTRNVSLALLVLLAGLPGCLYAGCDACPLATARTLGASHFSGGTPRVAPPCCPQDNASPTVRNASCCGFRAAVPAETSRAVVLSPAPAVAPALAAPVILCDEPVAARAAVPAPDPPPLHSGLGLYTLHSVFLI